MRKIVEFMMRTSVEIANQCGYTGMKRVAFYIAATFVCSAACVCGFIKGIVAGFKLSMNL